MKSLFSGVKQLSSEENKQLAKQIREGDQKARKRMIEGNTGFAYKRAIKYSKANQGWGHIDGDDILQSAFLGLVEAVDRYDPTKLSKEGKAYAFTTFAHFWILKRINEEVWQRHWNTMRPPRTEMREFLYKKMGYDASNDYVDQFMYRGDGSADSRDYEEGYLQADILSAVEQAGLTKIELRVFNSLYGANQQEDKLDDLTKKRVEEVEDSMLEKLRGQFE